MTEPEENDHSAPEHFVMGGERMGWSATDLTEDELVDDEWIRQNTRPVE